MPPEISALIICGDRLGAVTRCLQSLEKLGDRLHEVLLLQNAPSSPWPADCFASVASSVRQKLSVIESDTRLFPTTGRNRLAERATGAVYLFLDDDSLVLDHVGIEKGLQIFRDDLSVGSIAYPQSTEAGELAPYMQPAPVDHACFACGFMTCAAMTRASVYHQLGGFQELLQMAHEENEFCKRHWDAGYAVLYLPDRCICHNPSPVARNSRQRAKLNARNIWYQAVLHEPLWLLPFTLLPRFLQAALYLRYAHEWTGGGWLSLFWEATADFGKDLPALLSRRRPLSSRTIRLWQQLKQDHSPYNALAV